MRILRVKEVSQTCWNAINKIAVEILSQFLILQEIADEYGRNCIARQCNRNFVAIFDIIGNC